MLFTKNISAKNAKEVIFLPKDTAWICIHDEYEPPHQLKVSDRQNILELTFADVRGVTTHNGQVYHPMTISDTYKILDFVETNKDKTLLVNCNAGVSRSGAICFFIHKTYGHQLKDNFWHTSDPNPFVLGTLMLEYARKEANKK